MAPPSQWQEDSFGQARLWDQERHPDSTCAHTDSWQSQIDLYIPDSLDAAVIVLSSLEEDVHAALCPVLGVQN